MDNELDKQIDFLDSKVQTILETAFRMEDPSANIEHLLSTDSKLYLFLTVRANNYASTRRIIVDEMVKTFRMCGSIIKRTQHRMEIVDERAERIYRLEEEVKSKRVNTYIMLALVTIMTLWGMATLQKDATHMVFQFISSIFHGTVKLILGQ